MKNKFFALSLLFFTAAALTLWLGPAQADEKVAGPRIYDESADGSKQISDALVIAKKENKRLLLQFGANWCIWCQKLHKLYETDKAVAKQIKANYLLVMIDVNEDHNKDVDAKYGNPVSLGLPALVVLDKDGKQLTTQDTEKLSGKDDFDSAKVLAFLKQWAPKK